jgi:hypothetical protein
MARDLILGQLHPDLACAIALGFLENPQATVTLDVFTLFDPRLRTSRAHSGWLSTDDPLDVATREYLAAKRDTTLASPRTGQSGWAAASTIKKREEASKRAIEARARGLQLLQERGFNGSSLPVASDQTPPPQAPPTSPPPAPGVAPPDSQAPRRLLGTARLGGGFRPK